LVGDARWLSMCIYYIAYIMLCKKPGSHGDLG
jgi:hypothetical protein